MDSPEVKCLECGHSIPMVKMNNHIAEAHPYEMHPIKVCSKHTTKLTSDW